MTEIYTDNNIVKKEIYLEEGNRVHGTIWEPADGDFKMVLQIVHGMTEHIGRYERFAHELAAEGIVVAGLDLRGHGRNAGDYQIATGNPIAVISNNDFCLLLSFSHGQENFACITVRQDILQ